MNTPPWIQMEMNFDARNGNRFKHRLANGIFQLLLELDTPSADTRLSDAVNRFAPLETLLRSANSMEDMPACALAFTDRSARAETLDPLTFAADLCKEERSAHLFYLSGRDKSIDRLYAFAAHACSEGFRNFCAVSGETLPGEDAKELRSHLFTESVNILRHLSSEKATPAPEDPSAADFRLDSEQLSAASPAESRFFTGAAVNPFKYNICDNYTQYFKLIKKISNGASFVVTQYGWDMLKLQEMRWNLQRRSMHIPSIARILFLTPARAEAICAGKCPGVNISPDFEIALKQEMLYSSAQLRRIQLHAAGLKFLGYSGIQLAGVDQPKTLEILLERISGALHEFHSFDEWLEAFNEYYARMDMAPYPYRFYMFEDLMKTVYPPDEPRMKEALIAPCSTKERFRYRLGHLLFSHAERMPASDRLLTKKLFFSCRTCERCRLPSTFFVCPEECPKGMANGPCGESRANGFCEADQELECVFSKRMRLANEFHDYPAMEEIYINEISKRP